jgi:hypothetical protein
VELMILAIQAETLGSLDLMALVVEFSVQQPNGGDRRARSWGDSTPNSS